MNFEVTEFGIISTADALGKGFLGDRPTKRLHSTLFKAQRKIMRLCYDLLHVDSPFYR